MEDENKPLILVDSSYFSIKRATALISWWARAFPNDPKSSNLPWIFNTVYMEKYITLFKKNIDNLAKHYGVLPQNILFAKDCPIAEIWRKDIYCEYKANRATDTTAKTIEILSIPMSMEASGYVIDVSKMSSGWNAIENRILIADNFGFGPVVKFSNETFLPNGYVKTMSIERAEADDICAVIAMRVRKLQPNRQIVIVANDRDYLQIVDSRLSVVDIPKFKPITHKDPTLKSEEALLHKIIAGDTSDNIPSCGLTNAKKYACNPDLLKLTLASDPIIQKKFEYNKQLIDFKEIPNNIQEKIWLSFIEIAPGFKVISTESTMIPSTTTAISK